MVFARDADGWQAVWLHLYLRGRPAFNQVEGNAVGTAERWYLTMSYLLDRWRPRAAVTMWTGEPPDEPVTFVGIKAPDGSEIYTLDRLAELLPE